MKRDQERKADAEHDEWNKKVTVAKDGAKLLGFGHLCPGVWPNGWRNHKDESEGLSTRDGSG
jgi:hypothetical protein